MMKLYVWEEVLCDWTDGIIFALANNVDEARELVMDKYVDQDDNWEENTLRFSMQDEPKVYDSPAGFRLWGGG